MMLVTYQSKEAVEILQKTGELSLKEEDRKYTHLALDDDCVNHPFEYAYNYIINRMQIYPKDNDIKYPLWAWYRMNGRRKPTKTFDEIHKGNYRIIFEISDDQVLLTDFEMFSYILAGGLYFRLSKEDEAKYEPAITKEKNEYFYPNLDYMKQINHKKDGRVYFSSHHNSVQATFWKLTMDMVKDIKLI